jgi:hypothetical protein
MSAETCSGAAQQWAGARPGTVTRFARHRARRLSPKPFGGQTWCPDKPKGKLGASSRARPFRPAVVVSPWGIRNPTAVLLLDMLLPPSNRVHQTRPVFRLTPWADCC